MRKIILWVLVALILLVAGLCVYIASRPSSYTVTRSATVSAPPAAVFAQVNDFRNWDRWSPWARLDPAMKVSYSGPESGIGAAYAWAGNADVGEGRMTITDSKPTDFVKIDLEFIKPFAAKSVTQFDIKPSGDKTTVTWSMKGENNFIAKAFTLFMDMDKMIGKDFEKGLSQLKTLVESIAQPTGESVSELR